MQGKGPADEPNAFNAEDVVEVSGSSLLLCDGEEHEFYGEEDQDSKVSSCEALQALLLLTRVSSGFSSLASGHRG